MALILRDIALDLDQDEADLPKRAAAILGLDVARLQQFKILRRSHDARHRNRIRKIFTVCFACDGEEALLRAHPGGRLEKWSPPAPTPVVRLPRRYRVLIVGMGPAGLFAAKRLIEAGADITLIDRGRRVEERVRDVERFWTSGCLDPVSNVQFGEGGAGTFSDGKLTTRVQHPRRHDVLQTLVDFGAPEEILTDARPHVGTDRLRRIVLNFRQFLAEKGVALHYTSCLTGLEIRQQQVVGGVINDRDLIACDALVLATGHSARDTYRMLGRSGVQLDNKGFALGVRVEHPAELVNRIQYGRFADRLPAADYALRYTDRETERGVYSFCMCPGGEVINAASEADGLAVNGMSRLARRGAFSNSALVVTVRPADWEDQPCGGIAFQQHWERKAFAAAGGRFLAPAQNLMAFCGRGGGPLRSSCRPGVIETELREVLPDFVYHGLQRALPHFDRQMRGFLTGEAVLIGVETRTSAPVRITRNVSGMSVTLGALFPAGEGAGYAGGIMSAAFDGLQTADAVIRQVSCQESF
ncbi:MAG: FAD-dependent monooxygenase [Desulfuromonadales bacterium]